MSPKPPNGRLPQGNFSGVSPVLLSSSCDVAPNNSAIPDSGLLAYPFRKAVIIEEIRWTMRKGGNLANSGALVYVRMNLGQNYLMRDPVPIWLLGTRMSVQQEQANTTFLTTDTSYSHYRWRLPEPLYVEEGQVLSSVFSRTSNADGFSGDINVEVAYAGRTVAPGTPRPASIAIPYAAPFLTTPGVAYQQSNEKHLFNPFSKPLRIQRLTCRQLLFVSGSTALEFPAFTPATAGSAITVLMNDSWGGKMVPNNTGPSDVFDINRAAWTVDTMMPPKGVYEVRAWNMNTGRVLHMAMIGTREEAL